MKRDEETKWEALDAVGGNSRGDVAKAHVSRTDERREVSRSPSACPLSLTHMPGAHAWRARRSTPRAVPEESLSSPSAQLPSPRRTPGSEVAAQPHPQGCVAADSIMPRKRKCGLSSRCTHRRVPRAVCGGRTSRTTRASLACSVSGVQLTWSRRGESNSLQRGRVGAAWAAQQTGPTSTSVAAHTGRASLACSVSGVHLTYNRPGESSSSQQCRVGAAWGATQTCRA